MGGDENKRHWIVAVLLQIGIRLRFWTGCWFGIKPLFFPITAYPSPFRPKNAPKYDFVTRVGFVWTWYILALMREPNGLPVFYPIFTKLGVVSLVNAFHDWLARRLIAQMEASGYKSADREVPIPEYDWKNGDPETFYQTFVKTPHPVVLRGFMKNTALLKDLSWDKVLKKYGDEDVFLTRKEMDGINGKLREVDAPNTYLHNSEVLFNKYPQIRDLFQYERLEDYLHMKVGYEQIFVGRAGTGSPFHNASVYNMFYMVDGKKKWYFVDPNDTYLGYPVASLGRAAAVLCCLWPHEYNVEAFPLFKYCPVFTAELEPGDVLFNPPWWWHSIKNTSEHSVGVASRWHTDGIAGHNLVATEENYDIHRFLSFSFFSGLSSYNFLHGILQEPSPRFDEHTTLRERNNRYVHKQIKISEVGGVEYGGVTVKG